jgi:hypothetical protein
MALPGQRGLQGPAGAFEQRLDHVVGILTPDGKVHGRPQ